MKFIRVGGIDLKFTAMKEREHWADVILRLITSMEREEGRMSERERARAFCQHCSLLFLLTMQSDQLWRPLLCVCLFVLFFVFLTVCDFISNY